MPSKLISQTNRSAYFEPSSEIGGLFPIDQYHQCLNDCCVALTRRQSTIQDGSDVTE